jgi:hypothetical protein
MGVICGGRWCIAIFQGATAVEKGGTEGLCWFEVGREFVEKQSKVCGLIHRYIIAIREKNRIVKTMANIFLGIIKK